MRKMGRYDFSEIVRSETGKTAVKVDVDYSWTREVTIQLETHGKVVANVTLYDFDPDMADALGGLFEALADWQWRTEEFKREESKIRD